MIASDITKRQRGLRYQLFIHIKFKKKQKKFPGDTTQLNLLFFHLRTVRHIEYSNSTKANTRIN